MMDRPLSAAAAAAISVLLALSASACDLLGPTTENFAIRVDSIVAPATVSPNDTLRVRFLGRLGPDGCWNVGSIDKEATPSHLDVTFHGRHHLTGDCPQMPMYLDHTEALPPPRSYPFLINAHQPDGTVLTKTVGVQ